MKMLYKETKFKVFILLLLAGFVSQALLTSRGYADYTKMSGKGNAMNKSIGGGGGPASTPGAVDNFINELNNDMEKAKKEWEKKGTIDGKPMTFQEAQEYLNGLAVLCPDSQLVVEKKKPCQEGVGTVEIDLPQGWGKNIDYLKKHGDIYGVGDGLSKSFEQFDKKKEIFGDLPVGFSVVTDKKGNKSIEVKSQSETVGTLKQKKDGTWYVSIDCKGANKIVESTKVKKIKDSKEKEHTVVISKDGTLTIDGCKINIKMKPSGVSEKTLTITNIEEKNGKIIIKGTFAGSTGVLGDNTAEIPIDADDLLNNKWPGNVTGQGWVKGKGGGWNYEVQGTDKDGNACKPQK